MRMRFQRRQKIGRSGDCQKYKALKNNQRYKKDMWSKFRLAPHITFTIIEYSAGFHVLWFLMVIPSLLEELP